MNLINDTWIPVRRKSGAKIIIAPWQITEDLDNNPIIEITSARPDFNGALIQFFIGLLQTVCPPKGNKEWQEWFKNPPSPEQLKVKFNQVAGAFNLDGDGPRFMQDLTLEDESKYTKKEIDKILIDSPGKQTLKENKDFFIKRDRIENLCRICTAQALFTLQINAPLGGSGHMTGLRGGGPVTTIILQDNLWKTTWLNVLNKNSFAGLANSQRSEPKDKFPWLAKTRISKNNYSTTAQDINAAQIYWSMPRRIRLKFEHSNEKVDCSLCEEKSENFVSEYLTAGYGVKYQNPIIHPLTPTYMNEKKEMLSAHQHESIGYKHWLGFVQSIADNKQNKSPALIINEVFNRDNEVFNRGFEEFRLWAFGYDMDNMKARCWHDGVMPVLVLLENGKTEEYNNIIETIIKAAEDVRKSLYIAVRNALTNAPSFITARYWQETESDFYNILGNLREAVKNSDDKNPLKQEWKKILAKKAEQIFNESVQLESIEIVNVKRVAKAWNGLKKSIYGKKIKEILGLSEKEA